MPAVFACRRIARSAWLLAALVLLGAPAAAGDEPVEESWQKITSKSFETIQPGGNVRVRNALGNVYARFGGYEDRVEVQATTQRIEQDRPPLEVQLIPKDGNLEVFVREEGATGVPDADIERRDRVDLVVFVPRGAVFEVETFGNSIEAKGLKGELIASSVSGDISIRKIDGRVRAASERGKITAALRSGVTSDPQRFETQTGNIEVYLWEDANVEVDLATSGAISTDFSIDIEHRRAEEPGKYGTAKVGKGGPSLVLRSKRGAVSLFRLPTETAQED